MARQGRTLMIQVIAAIAISAGIDYQFGISGNMEPRMTALYVALMSLVVLAMAFLWGATNAGIAALWAALRNRPSNTPAAFNFGVTAFLVLQALAFPAYEYLKTSLPRTEISANSTPSEQLTIMETK